MSGRITPDKVKTVEQLVEWCDDMERDVIAFQIEHYGRDPKSVPESYRAYLRLLGLM